MSTNPHQDTLKRALDDVIGEDDDDDRDRGEEDDVRRDAGEDGATERVVAARVTRDDDEDDEDDDATSNATHSRIHVTFVRDDDDGDHDASTATREGDDVEKQRATLQREVWRTVLRVCDDDENGDDGEDAYAFEGDNDGGDVSHVAGGSGAVDEVAMARPRLDHENEDDVEAFRMLLESALNLNLDVDAKSDDGDGALHLASLYGKTAFVKELIAAGATVAVRDESGGTPLHDACASGHLAIVHELCLAATKNGTIMEYIHMTDEDGEQCLHLAARGEHHEIVSYLLENGADARSMNSDGRTPADVCEDESLANVLRQAAAAAR